MWNEFVKVLCIEPPKYIFTLYIDTKNHQNLKYIIIYMYINYSKYTWKVALSREKLVSPNRHSAVSADPRGQPNVSGEVKHQ